MSNKPVSDTAKLQLENIGLKLTVLQLQADNIVKDRNQLLEKEATRLDCLSWPFDLQKMEFVEPPVPKTPANTSEQSEK